MREIRYRAEYLLIKSKGELRREELLLKGIVLGLFLCTGALFSLKILIPPAVAGIILLSYFYFAGSLYCSEKYFLPAGETGDFPILRFSAVLRYAVFRLCKSVVKLLWLNFFLLPSGIIVFIVVRTLALTGNIQRVMLYTLVAAFVLLSAVGLGFYFYLTGRYCLSELLFVRSPRQRPLEILRSSAVLTEGRLPVIMLFRIKNVFGKGGIAKKMRLAVFNCDLFTDRGFCGNYGLAAPLTFRELF